MLHKLFLYGGPGVGKSVFALQFPNPFFITTDGNFEFLKIFGAKEEDHKQCWSWKEIKSIIQELYTTDKYDKYQTIVLDLVEDAWKWCESEWLEKNKIDHPSDMGYGKAYDVPRNKFFIEIGKLLGVPKNIILLSHEFIDKRKTKKGIEWNIYMPSNKLPDKLMDSIEGRLTACLRCYTDVIIDENSGKQKKVRLLNLIPQDDEFGIIRGVNEDKTPHTIELKYSIFNKVLEEQQVEAAQEFLRMMEEDTDVIEIKKNKKEKTKEESQETVSPIKKRVRTKQVESEPEVKPEVKAEETINKEEDIDVKEFDVSDVDEEKAVEMVEETKELTNEEKKANILNKIRKFQKAEDNVKVESEPEKPEPEKNNTSKEDILKKLRAARKQMDKKEEVEVVEETKETPSNEEKKVETREEKLAKLRKMRGL